MKKIPQDIIGSIAILKFPKKTSWIIRKLRARQFLRQTKQVTTVLEKIEGFSGRLRKPTTRYLAGIRTTETVHTEHGCTFFLDVNDVYFSPRLSHERLLIAKEVERVAKRKKKCHVLVMFGGVGAFSIVIARHMKRLGKDVEIITSEINRCANEFAKKNVAANSVDDYVNVIGGDSKALVKKSLQTFDIIIMPRPNLKDTFLETALTLAKKRTKILYYGFGTEKSVREEIIRGGKKRIGRINMRKAGDIAAYEFRWLATFNVK